MGDMSDAKDEFEFDEASWLVVTGVGVVIAPACVGVDDGRKENEVLGKRH